MSERNEITIALPKGKLGAETLDVLERIGLPCQGVETDSRKLKFEFPEEKVRYLICRPTDVPTYVEYGAADLGIVGKDVLVESEADVFELVDLGYSYCKVVLALPRAFLKEKYAREEDFELRDFNHCRVASKFPRIAKNYFNEEGVQAEVIKLHGNIELAPIAGLSEMIVDIVSTGNTLKQNDLVPVCTILEATARLIANRVSYRMKTREIQPLIASLKK